MDRIKSHFEEASEILDKFLSDNKNFEKIEQAGKMMVSAVKNGGKIIPVAMVAL